MRPGPRRRLFPDSAAAREACIQQTRQRLRIAATLADIDGAELTLPDESAADRVGGLLADLVESYRRRGRGDD